MASKMMNPNEPSLLSYSSKTRLARKGDKKKLRERGKNFQKKMTSRGAIEIVDNILRKKQDEPVRAQSSGVQIGNKSGISNQQKIQRNLDTLAKIHNNLYMEEISLTSDHKAGGSFSIRLAEERKQKYGPSLYGNDGQVNQTDGLYRDDPDAPAGIYRDDPSSDGPHIVHLNSTFLSRGHKPQRRSKQCWLYVLMGVLVVLLMVVGAHLTTRGNSDKGTNDDSSSGGVSDNTFKTLQDRLNVGGAVDETRIQTLEWLANEPDVLMLGQTALVERYAVALLFFSLGGPQEAGHVSFLTESSVCDWNDGDDNGVLCNPVGRVDVIELPGYSLEGTLPRELALLENLRSFNMATNHLQGSVPSEYGTLTRLEHFVLVNNALTGTIPTELGSLSLLKNLNLSNNRLTGSLPTEVGNCEMIYTFRAQNNTFTGTIPTEFGRLSSLGYLNLGFNLLEGTIPLELKSMDSIVAFQFHENLLTGSIPDFVWGFANLVYLLLEGNENVEGRIPESVSTMQKLEELRLSHTGITGYIPDGLSHVQGLKKLDVSSTSMSGQLSPHLSALTQLEEVHFQNTQLFGDLDFIFCSNGIHPTVFQADCATDNSPMICTCCTTCF